MLRAQQAKDDAITDDTLIEREVDYYDSAPLHYQVSSARARLPKIREEIRLATLKSFASGDITIWNARLMAKFAKETAAYEALVSAAEKKEKDFIATISRAVEKLAKTRSPAKGVYVRAKKLAHPPAIARAFLRAIYSIDV